MQTAMSVPAAFSHEECDRIIRRVTESRMKDAGLVGQVANHNIRRADIAWLDEVDGAGWIMDRIVRLVAAANRDAFAFDLTEFSESAQVARYGAEREGHFDWHSDIGDGPLARRRKLTMVVQLSEDEAYTGGALETMPDSAVRTAARTRGDALLFPSFVLHRVTPVTQGERYSLTIWAHGPAFR